MKPAARTRPAKAAKVARTAGAAAEVAEAHASDGDPRRLLHELEIHQVELLMQNEQLESARDWINAALAAYTELFDFAPIAYLTLDRAGAVVEANVAATKLFGLKRSELLEMRCAAFLAERDLRGFDHYLRSVFAAQEPSPHQLTLMPADGAATPTVEIRALLSQDGSHCRAVMIDVSEQAERARRLAGMEQAFAQAPEAMLITDQHGLIVDVNAAFSGMTGYSGAQALGRHARMLGDGAPGAAHDGMWDALAAQGVWSGALRGHHADGREQLLRAHVNGTRDADGKLQYYVFRLAPHGA